ncbi:MAG: hypothetical protein HC845_02370 [Akkermansiaceae bacterium]|nr:hypothetical protein [Akkermansiaceae bacterium]
MKLTTPTRGLLMACGLSSAFLVLTASSALAETPNSYRLIQRNANRVTAIADRLVSWVDRLQLAEDVVPDGIYRESPANNDVVPPIFDRSALRKLQSGLEEIADHIDIIAALAKSSGKPGLIGEAAELQETLETAPDRDEISQAIFRGAPSSELIEELTITLEALKNAAPCIRREIQELDE